MQSNLTKLIFVQSSSNFASSIILYYFIYQTMNKTDSALATGSIGTMAILPSLILFPFVGYLIDSFSKKKVLVISISIKILILLAFMFLIQKLDNQFFITNILVFLMFLLRTFISPIVDSVIPQIVNEEHLQKANSNVNFFNTLIDVISPVVAGLLFFGDLGVIFLCVFLYIGCLTFASLIYLSPIKNNKFKKKNIFEDILVGYSFIIKSKSILILVISFSFINFLIVPLNSVVFPALSFDLYKEGSVGTGLLISGYSVGFLVGSLLLRVIRVSFLKGIVISTLLLIVSFIFYNLFGHIIIGIIGAFTTGVAILGIVVFSTTLFQYITPDEIRGRVFTARKTLSMSLGPIGIFIFGFLVDKYQITTILYFSCLISLLLLLVIIIFINQIRLDLYSEGTGFK